MSEELLRLIYQKVKQKFSGIDARHWIWIDFFKIEKSGFKYFKWQIENDDELHANHDTESPDDIADYIYDKLSENAIFNNFCQDWYNFLN